MNDDLSPRLSLPYLAAGQAQKEMVLNEALQAIDALVQPVALSAALSEPPAAMEVGDCWIVGADATGAWTGHSGAVAQWTAGGWRFVKPREGWRWLVTDRATIWTHRMGAWTEDAVRDDGLYIRDNRIVGERMSAIAGPSGGTIVDDQARAVIGALLAVLRGHGLIET